MQPRLWRQIVLNLFFLIAIATAVVFYAIYNLGTVSQRLLLIENADDLNLTILELRRYEKNIILFNEDENVRIFNGYLKQLDDKIHGLGNEFLHIVKDQEYQAFTSDIQSYKETALSLIKTVQSESRIVREIRPLGRALEQGQVPKALALELRRNEKNYIIYKEGRAAENLHGIAREIVALQPGLRTPMTAYLKAFDSLSQAEALKQKDIVRMRLLGRSIEKFTLDFSRKERDAIDRTIATAKKLLVGAFLFLVVMTGIKAFLFARDVTGTCNTMTRSLHRLKEGDFTHGISVDEKRAPEEIVSLVKEYNATVANLRHSKEELDSTMHKLEDTNRELLEKQEELAEAKKLTAMRLLASEIAHEINNPLSSVTTLLGIFHEDSRVSDAQRESFELMLQETSRCQIILRELADFARREPLNLRETDPSRLIHDAIEVTKKQHPEKTIHISSYLDGLPGKAVLDPILVYQALVNILNNAFHFTPSGWSIDVRGYADDRFLVISVCDKGAGIPEETLPHIFEPFFSTRKESGGSGLGLAITKKIVERHRGDIHVESWPGEGTVFNIVLPVNGVQA